MIPIDNISKSLLDKFWKRVDRKGSDDCWLWMGARDPRINKNYGLINLGNRYSKQIRAHRLSYIIHNGPIPEGLYVLHHCDNPPCVNPAHLHVGTQKDNVHEAIQRGRHKFNRQRNKLTEEQVIHIIEERKKGTKLSILSEELGVSLTTIHDTSLGKIQMWRYLLKENNYGRRVEI